MIKILSYISISIIPIFVLVILVHGIINKVDVYQAFIEGAKEGFKTAFKIMPYLIAVFIAIGFMKESGSIDILTSILSPLMNVLGIPSEILPLAIIRPISGTGALAMTRDIITEFGPDSYLGRIASILMGSSETIFYTIAVYFGAVGIKNTRYIIPAGLIAHLAAIIASVTICNILF